MKSNFKKIKKNGGAAMLLSVVFFLFISLSIIVGLVSPTVLEFKNANTNLKSKQSYFLAESGSEDAVYRIVSNKTISDSETITLGSNSVITSITSIGNNQKQIISLGDVLNYQRKVNLLLKTGTGVVFKYGTQAGAGGIKFGDDSGLYGTLYSNGDIVGSNNHHHDSSFITGDAFAANNLITDPEQSNGATGTPPNSVVFGNSNNTQDFAQSFQVANAGRVGNVQFYIKKIGRPSNATVRLTTNNNGEPNSHSIITGTLNANLITSSYGWVDINFSRSSLISANTTYWVVIDGHSDSNDYYNIAANTNFNLGTGKIGKYDDHDHFDSWDNTNPAGLDGYFRFFFQGLMSEISNINIGTDGIGDAYANKVTNSLVEGNIFCQTGSNNNKICDTSRDDPAPADFPVSDANIAQWKADALSGGTINGNYTVNGNRVDSIGLKKINGNLTIEGTLEITNTIWVTGTLHIKKRVKLSPSFGGTSGIIIVDGNIIIDRDVVFEDSGTPGSYVILITTSICDTALTNNPCGSKDAVEINHRSDISIIYASKGAVDFNSHSKVKEVVGYRIRLKDDSYIEYGSGVLNPYFTSGPLGGWVLSGWREVK
ncbi:MAG: choice-of-anchor R domain-containing protein [Minisyncoccia bacterium]